VPPKVKNTHRDLSAADKKLHGELFTKAVRGARTMHEIHELLCDGTPIPTYHYGSGKTKDVVLTASQRSFLNGGEWMTEDHQTKDFFGARSVRNIVEDWPSIIEEIGEPKATDKPLQWSVYDLLRIASHVTTSLHSVNHAIEWNDRYREEKSVL
jgi:hypothetical protein